MDPKVLPKDRKSFWQRFFDSTIILVSLTLGKYTEAQFVCSLDGDRGTFSSRKAQQQRAVKIQRLSFYRRRERRHGWLPSKGWPQTQHGSRKVRSIEKREGYAYVCVPKKIDL